MFFRGKTYKSCTTDDSENKQPWCAYEVNRNGEVVRGKWADCEPGFACSGSKFSIKNIIFLLK